jgi:hypothetical protein
MTAIPVTVFASALSATLFAMDIGSAFLLFGWGLGFVGLIYSIYWIVMLIHCVRFEPDKTFWLWLLVVAPFPGAIVYGVVRFFPAADLKAPTWMQRWVRNKELTRLATATETIGNAHQFVQYGDALRETGQWDAAGTAYEGALRKDAENLPALWGAAQVAMNQKRWADVRRYCEQILRRDAQYRFGDASFLYGKALLETSESAAGRAHLEKHCLRWRQPEAIYMLAECCFTDGDHTAARTHLLDVLRDINGSPTAIARKHGRWKSLARRLLQKLPKNT